MARSFVINGECLVIIRFGGHVTNFIDGPQTAFGLPTASPSIQNHPGLFQLGLAEREIKVSPRITHKDVPVDDFGNAPVETLYSLTECNVSMTLIHYDALVLEKCISESMGGCTSGGTLAAYNAPMGGLALPIDGPASSGCHYMGVYLTSPVLGLPYRFRTCYLTGNPVVIPMGTKRTLAQLNWRAIAYNVPTMVNVAGSSGDPQSSYQVPGDFVSSGVVVWDRNTSLSLLVA